MSSNCLSSATIVRCEDLNRGENAVIFIPAVVQLLLLLGLTCAYWGSGRKRHFLLVADAWAFFVLTLIDLLSHFLPSARDSLHTFKVFDIVIGVLSFLPVLLYTVFLYTISRTFCLPLFRRLIRKVAHFALLVSIPVSIATNELGSFIGISYRAFPGQNNQNILAIGYTTDGNQTIWLFFTSVTLLLLILLQVFVLSFSLYLIIRIANEHRRGGGSRASTFSSDSNYTVPDLQGMVWIMIGVKLGIVETLLGFVDGGFRVVLVRRLLRMLSRCCLAFGAIRTDTSTSSRSSTPSLYRGRSMTQFRGMISNPRFSTFERLTPSATTFYAQPRATVTEPGDGRANTLYGPRPQPSQRVTVRFDGDKAPSLDVRLSGLGLPTPEDMTERFNKRGTLLPTKDGSVSDATRSRSSSRSLFAVTSQTPPTDSYALPRELDPVAQARDRSYSADEAMGGSSGLKISSAARPNPRYTQYDMPSPRPKHSRIMSASSLASDSLSIVHDLAVQFPGIPPRQTLSTRYQQKDRRPSATTLDQVNEESSSRKSQAGHDISPSNSMSKRKPPPTVDVIEAEPVPELVNPFEVNLSEQESLGRSGSGKSEKSLASSMKRKGLPIPPPITVDSSVARASMHRRARSGSTNDAATAYDYRVRTRAYSATPGMTTDTSTALSPSSVVTIDPFRDNENALRESEMFAAEGGLGGIAARVAAFDQQRMASYRGLAGSVPLKDPFVSASEVILGKSKGKSKEPSRPPPSPSRSTTLSISSPRRLSGSRAASSSRSSWVGTPQSSAAAVAIESVRRENLRSAGPARIKSVGQVSTHTTPTPSTSSFGQRQSMRIDDFGDMPERARIDSTPRKFPIARVEGGSPSREREVGGVYYDSPYNDRRIRRESEGEWEL